MKGCLSRAVDHQRALLWLLYAFSSFLTCDMKTVRVPVTWLKILEGSGSSRQDRHDAVDGFIGFLTGTLQHTIGCFLACSSTPL